MSYQLNGLPYDLLDSAVEGERRLKTSIDPDVSTRLLSGFSPFNELRTVERTPVITLSSIYPISRLRDVATPGVVFEVDEYRVPPGESTESAELIRYIPGYPSEVGIGFRLGSVQDARWGAFDDRDGVFWQIRNGSDLAVGIKRENAESIIPQADWNIDKLDGTGPSGIDITGNTNGLVWQVIYTWYGYGPILWQILDNRSVKPQTWPVHALNGFDDGTSIRNPNLPIRAENTGTTGDAYLAGRQWSVVGRYVPNERVTAALASDVALDTTWRPILSVRRRASDQFRGFSFATKGMQVVYSGEVDAIFAVVLGADLTGADFDAANALLRTSGETGLEFDVSADGAIDGVADAVTGPLFLAGTPDTGRGPSQPTPPADGGMQERIRLPRDEVFTVVGRTTSGTGTASVLASFVEEW